MKNTKQNIDKTIDFIVLTLFILFMASSASFMVSDVFVVISFFFLVVVFFIRKIKIDRIVYFVLCIWILVNIISCLINSQSKFSIISFVGVTLRIIMPYFMVKVIGYSFFDRFFKYAYALVLISFPFFLIESIYPSFIFSITPYLNFITAREQFVSNGFYIFIYMHSGWAENTGLFVRNSGFIWEPGAYACVLTFMLTYYLYITNYKVDKRVIILILALLSTFSTAGYIALFIILIFLVINNKIIKQRYSIFMPIILSALIFSGILFYSTSPFMKDKINKYIEMGTDTYTWEFENESIVRVSRLGIAMASIDNALHRPWGEGIMTSEYIVNKYGNISGPSSLAEILRQWGWLGLIVCIISMYKLSISGRRIGLILLIPMLIVLLSNPFLFKYLIYAIIYYHFIYSKKNKIIYIKRILPYKYNISNSTQIRQKSIS